MKKALIFTAVLAAAVSLQAQGLITFANNSSTAISNAVTGGRATSTTPIWIGLFFNSNTAGQVGDITDPAAGWVLSTPPVSIGNFAGLFSGSTRSFGDVAQVVLLQIGIWDKAFSGDAAGFRAAVDASTPRYLAVSPLMGPGALGGGSNPTPSLTGNPFNFQSMRVGIVPEPSTLALGLLGAIGTLVLFRRRR